MTILEKFHKIETAKQIYNIHYCNAGVGFQFYDPDKDDGIGRQSWKSGLTIDKYYPSFVQAVEGEFARLPEPDHESIAQMMIEDFEHVIELIDNLRDRPERDTTAEEVEIYLIAKIAISRREKGNNYAEK